MFEQEKKTLLKKNLKSECWPESECRRRCEGRLSILPWQSAEKKNHLGPDTWVKEETGATNTPVS